MSREDKRTADGPSDGHWSRRRTFEINTRVQLKPTGADPIAPDDLGPIERLLGTRFAFTPELLEELRTLSLGVDEWLRQDPGHLRIFLDDANDGIERAVAAGLAAPMSDALREVFESAARDARPRAVRATAVHETTLVPFTEEGDVGAS